MKSLNEKLREFMNEIKSVKEGLKVYHYEKAAKATAPYVVWAEEGEDDSLDADNNKEEQQIEGWLEFYTQTEFDSAIDDIQEKLNEITCGWRLDAVQYEDETKLIHYSWTWRIA